MSVEWTHSPLNKIPLKVSSDETSSQLVNRNPCVGVWESLTGSSIIVGSMEGWDRQAETFPKLQASNPAKQLEFHGDVNYVNAERELPPSLSALFWLAPIMCSFLKLKVTLAVQN